ncbi:hypothetical protein EON65_23850 [archaeon]|nr:MAG: hypothetical protein EON65_23850 [archaeon]
MFNTTQSKDPPKIERSKTHNPRRKPSRRAMSDLTSPDGKRRANDAESGITEGVAAMLGTDFKVRCIKTNIQSTFSPPIKPCKTTSWQFTTLL